MADRRAKGPSLSGSDDRGTDRVVSADPVAMQFLRRRRRDQQLGRLALRSAPAPARHGDAVLQATDDDLEELIGSVSAEANDESNRPRQQRLDTAFETLSNAAQAH
jgi:hypothetical protein